MLVNCISLRHDNDTHMVPVAVWPLKRRPSAMAGAKVMSMAKEPEATLWEGERYEF